MSNNRGGIFGRDDDTSLLFFFLLLVILFGNFRNKY